MEDTDWGIINLLNYEVDLIGLLITDVCVGVNVDVGIVAIVIGWFNWFLFGWTNWTCWRGWICWTDWITVYWTGFKWT